MQSSISNNAHENIKSKNLNKINMESCLNFNNIELSSISKSKDAKKNFGSFNSNVTDKSNVRKSNDGILLKNKLESTPESIVLNKRAKDTQNKTNSGSSQKYEKSPFMKKKKVVNNNVKLENKKCYSPPNSHLKNKKADKVGTTEPTNKLKKVNDSKNYSNNEISRHKLKSAVQINQRPFTSNIQSNTKSKATTETSFIERNSEIPTLSSNIGASMYNDYERDPTNHINVSSFSDEEVELVSKKIRKFFLIIKFSSTNEY